MKIKTGEVMYRDSAGNLMQAISYVDEDGVVTTEETCVEPAPPPPVEAPTEESAE